MTIQGKIKLSLVVITLNEETNIERCLRSVPFASDVVVLDSSSQDKTLEIAQQNGARVFSEQWRGFGQQKRRAVELAKHDWILSLDADEALSPELAREIELLFHGAVDEHIGFSFPRKSFYLKRWIMHGGWYPDWQKRLFHRGHSNWEGDIHEKVHSAKEQRLQAPLEHYVFRNISEQVQTNDRYSSLQASQHFARGQKFSLGQLIFKPWLKFVECYFLKRGFLDGLPGFIIAVSAAYSVFIRWGKVWESEKGMT